MLKHRRKLQINLLNIQFLLKEEQEMPEKAKENVKLHWEDVKTIELERILNLYGMNKKQYCELFSKSPTWWTNVVLKRKNKILLYNDIRVLADDIGAETFNELLKKVRKENNKVEK